MVVMKLLPQELILVKGICAISWPYWYLPEFVPTSNQNTYSNKRVFFFSKTKKPILLQICKYIQGLI